MPTNKILPAVDVKAVRWFAMRSSYGRVIKMQEYLGNEDVETFVAMTYVDRQEKGVRVKKLVPAISNLIFVHTNLETILRLKFGQPLSFIINKEDRRPLVVSDREMENFIRVAGRYEEKVIYINEIDVNTRKGTRVRIVDGPFKGVEGEFMRIKDNRRVVVKVSGLAVVATHFIHPSQLEVIEE